MLAHLTSALDWRTRRRDAVTPQQLALLCFSVITAACGQLLLKLGALKLGTAEATGLPGRLWAMVTIPELIAGFAVYGTSAIAYIFLLTRVKLSVAAPSTALIYVLSVLIGFFVFKEPVSFSQLLGLAFIAFGVILVVSR